MQLLRINFNEYSMIQLEIMNTSQLYILLADDDEDDCHFFQEALDELSIATRLTAVHDGEQLMKLLTEKASELPHVLFLDLNMPRKNGYECLREIKSSEQLKPLPVVILSTSFERDVADRLYRDGASCCMRKPSGHDELKGLIQQALTLVMQESGSPPATDIVVVG